MAATQTLSGPPAELRFRPKLRLVASLRGLWRSRELVRSLAEREIRARYKQAVLGFAWALITPLALMLVFAAFFQRVAKVQTSGAPYALFAYLGLLPWTFFSTSMSQGGQSLILNTSLLNKVYCPREVFPLASVVVAGTDMAVATVALVVLFPIMGYMPRATSAWVPVLLLIQVAFTAGVTLAMSAVIVYLRDLRHALPILLQLGLFATPVAYGIDAIPHGYRVLYSTLNPLAPVIDGYRRTVLLGKAPDWHLLGPGAAAAAVVLLGGYLAFRRMETGFADVA